tara:strand:- start:955 stop:1107 length:153 start_codon:yes stop_codon:yes gene_type:complete
VFYSFIALIYYGQKEATEMLIKQKNEKPLSLPSSLLILYRLGLLSLNQIT